MGQKTHPHLLRTFNQSACHAKWFDDASYARCVASDHTLRQYLLKEFYQAGIARVELARTSGSVQITIFCARPGIIIGKKGADIEDLRRHLSVLEQGPVQLSVKEIKKVDLEAKLVAESIANQLERRVMYRKAMKRAIQSTMRSGAKGIRVIVSGRLGGAEIARAEKYTEGQLPLSTFRADIDHYHAIAKTTYGIIGVKVWIHRDKTRSNKKTK